MHLKITHTTRYRFDAPVTYGLQQVRKTPKSNHQQDIKKWTTTVVGGRNEVAFEDHHRNSVQLISFDRDAQSLDIVCEGEVAMTDTQGIVGRHMGPAPLWLYKHETALTKSGKATRALAQSVEQGSPLERMHRLSGMIRNAVAYKVGASQPDWTAETVVAEGCGVCQDHTHVFLTCARLMDIPARYVSGYLMLDDRIAQEAMHAWAEAYVDGLGWVGFDISNGISPDMRYVRVATGLDYSDAAPVIGTRQGGTGETLSVQIEVAQQ